MCLASTKGVRRPPSRDDEGREIDGVKTGLGTLTAECRGAVLRNVVGKRCLEGSSPSGEQGGPKNPTKIQVAASQPPEISFLLQSKLNVAVVTFFMYHNNIVRPPVTRHYPRKRVER